MIRAITHCLFGGRTLDLDKPRLRDWGVEDDSDPTPEERKDPIRVVLRRVLNQFVHDRAAYLTMLHQPQSNVVRLDYLVQVPSEWKATSEWGIKRKAVGEFEYFETPLSEEASTAPCAAAGIMPLQMPLGPESPNMKWCWVSLMPVPDFLFGPLWDRIHWHMRTIAGEPTEGTLAVSFERRRIELRVSHHAGTLIVIQRPATVEQYP